MKLSNIFKKGAASENSTSKKAGVQILDKNQLEKVIGGGDGTIIDSTTATEGGPLKGLPNGGAMVHPRPAK